MIISDDEDDFAPPTQPTRQAGTMIVNTERSLTGGDNLNNATKPKFGGGK
jgi:hypothetical protein